jgi:hypothetical protein
MLTKRSSINRAKGTEEFKNKMIDREKYKDLLIEKVIQSIIDKWPLSEFQDPNFKIMIQQDNAGGHCEAEDAAIKECTFESIHLQHKIGLYCQPPNSLEMNICDLGLFNALQAE